MPGFTFDSSPFTVEWLELLGLFTMENGITNTVTCKNRIGLLNLLNMKTRMENTFICENWVGLLRIQDGMTPLAHGGWGRTTAHGRGCHDLLNRNLTFLTMRGRANSSTDGRRGRTNADGRERHGLLNRHFFNKANTGHMGRQRELLAMRLFTFKSENTDGSEVCAWA